LNHLIEVWGPSDVLSSQGMFRVVGDEPVAETDIARIVTEHVPSSGGLAALHTWPGCLVQDILVTLAVILSCTFGAVCECDIARDAIASHDMAGITVVPFGTAPPVGGQFPA
jgi:hypothetical protein